MKDCGKRILASLLTGYVFFFYGEIVFWATPDREGMGGVELIITWMVYSFFAYVFLCVVSLFKVRSIWAVFLAGAFFGWYEEGIVLQTTHGTPDNPLPMSISWTGLAWHALIDALVGWFLVRKTLDQKSVPKTILLACSIGAFYGFWSIFWWTEPPESMKLLIDAGRMDLVFVHFSIFSLAASAILIFAYWLYDRIKPFAFKPGKFEVWSLIVLTVVYFCLVTAPASPIALAVIPVFMGITLMALNRNRLVEKAPDAIDCFDSNVSLTNYLCLLFMPLTAITIYFVAFTGDILLQTNLAVYYSLSVIGFFLWVFSVVTILRKPIASA